MEGDRWAWWKPSGKDEDAAVRPTTTGPYMAESTIVLHQSATATTLGLTGQVECQTPLSRASGCRNVGSSWTLDLKWASLGEEDAGPGTDIGLEISADGRSQRNEARHSFEWDTTESIVYPVDVVGRIDSR